MEELLKHRDWHRKACGFAETCWNLTTTSKPNSCNCNTNCKPEPTSQEATAPFRSENLHRARRRLRQLQRDYANGKIDLETIEKSLQSWRSHLQHGDTHRLQQDIFTSLKLDL